MRRRIYNLANGDFEHERPELSLSTERLEIQALEGKNYKGSFTIHSENGIPMRGVVYTSNARMECLNSQFEGTTAQIQFEFHSRGLIEGNIQKGDFFIICNQNEYNLSFVVTISRLYAESSIGKIRSLHDFAKLAVESRREAYGIFSSPMFANLMKQREHREQMLYTGLAKSAPSMASMEEFLIACKQKSPIRLSAPEEMLEFGPYVETVKEGFELTKDQWGYLEIELCAKADFLRLFKEKITVDDFVGKSARIEFLIKEEKLHAGKNFGQISIKTPYQELEVGVCVHQPSAAQRRAEAYGLAKEARASLMQGLLDVCVGRRTQGNWVPEAVAFLDCLIQDEPEAHWYALMKAQVYLFNGQKQEADWILEEKKKAITDRGSVAWAYYLYLTAYVIQEESYTDKVLRQVEEIAKRKGKDARMAWMLLNLRKDCSQNAYVKLHAIEEYMMAGCNSLIFYLEAYRILAKEPFILTELGAFEGRVLIWMLQKKVLTKEIALQVMELAGDCRTFEKRIYQVLCGCYEICPGEEMLTVICAYLIKGQKYETTYHHWYEEGIARDLRLAGLYEAYVYSMDRRAVRQVPKMVQMYFRYQSNLPYANKAALYVNIIANKDEQPSVYDSYERTMETFAIEQLLEGHIDDNLAVLYDHFLRETLVQKEAAKVLGELLFCHKLTCFHPDMVRIHVVHRQLKDGMTVPLVGGVAYFPIYSSEYLIFLEDRAGRRYASSMEYQLEKLMRPARYVERCMELAPECISFLIYILDKRPSLEDFTEKEALRLQTLLDSDRISEAYRSDLYPQALRLFQKYQIPMPDAEKMLKVNPSYLNPGARKYMMDLLIERGDYALAYRWIQMYGHEQMGMAELAKLVHHLVREGDAEEDDLLPFLCADVFFAGKYDEEVLACLCANYDGPTKTLGTIWKAAKDFGVDTFELEERILTQMLYTTEYVAEMEDIFVSYVKNGGRDVIRQAYIHYSAYAYFLDGMVLSDDFLQYLTAREEAQRSSVEVCRLAVLKYLAGEVERQQEHFALMEILLAEFVSEGRMFAFYNDLPAELLQKYGLEDKTFVEYRGAHKKKVWISYRMEGEEEYVKKEMRESYAGIYVSEFLLFFGESVQYYISQGEESEQEILESNQIAGREAYGDEERSRYALLNHMAAGLMLEDTEKAKACMLEYEKKEELYQEVFRIL